MLPKLPPRAIALGEKHSDMAKLFWVFCNNKIFGPRPSTRGARQSTYKVIFHMFGKHNHFLYTKQVPGIINVHTYAHMQIQE